MQVQEKRHLMPSTAKRLQDIVGRITSCKKARYLHCTVKITGRELRNILKYQKFVAHKTVTGGKSTLNCISEMKIFLKIFKVIIKFLQTLYLSNSLSVCVTNLLKMTFLNNNFVHKIYSNSFCSFRMFF